MIHSANPVNMQIPKVIHYCWFGRGKKSELMRRCISSWKQFCPSWEIIEWNEDNFDVNFCDYTRRAYQEKKYGFVADAARLKIIYEHGGVYLDTDVELRRPLDELVNCSAWFGYGTKTEINTGSGFGAVAGEPVVKALLDNYMGLPYDAAFKMCTERDTEVFKWLFPEFKGDGSRQEFGTVIVLGNIWHYVEHHYTHTWMTPFQKWRSRNRIWNMLLNFMKHWRK